MSGALAFQPLLNASKGQTPTSVQSVQQSKDLSKVQGSQVVLVVKNPPANARRCKRREFDPWVGKILWRRRWQPTPVFLLGKSHRQRSLAGYSPWGHKESDTAEHTCIYISTL